MNQIILPGILVLVLAAVVALLWHRTLHKQTLTFSEHNRYVANPFQGFYTQVDTREPGNMSVLTVQGIPLVLLVCNLNGYQASPLDESKLEEVDHALAEAAAQGLGVIFRAAYGFEEGWDTAEPDKLDQVLVHIGQLAEVLNRHADNIMCVQAGMLGPWGEWHSSTLMGSVEAQGVRVRNAVAAAWVENLDDTIIVQLRRPLFVRQAVESGLPLQQLGHHNDALLASDTDMGTYEDGTSRSTELSWISLQLPHGMFGGEMPQLSAYTEAENAISEFERLHLTYLNSQYSQEVLGSWRAQIYQGEQAFAYIERHMGSRLYLQTAKLPKHLPALIESDRVCEITLANTGFAPAQDRLSYRLVFRQNGQVYHPEQSFTDWDKEEDGGITLRGPLQLPDALDKNSEFSVGLWVGYGSPGEAGQSYSLANELTQGIAYSDAVLYFAKFHPAAGGWHLTV